MVCTYTNFYVHWSEKLLRIVGSNISEEDNNQKSEEEEIRNRKKLQKLTCSMMPEHTIKNTLVFIRA